MSIKDNCKYNDLCDISECVTEYQHCYKAEEIIKKLNENELQHKKELLKELIIEIQDTARITPDYVSKVKEYIDKILEIIGD